MANPPDLEQLKQKLDQLSDEQLKREYLRGAFTFDSLASVLPQIDSEVLSLRVIRLTLKWDLIQGALLTQAVKPEFQSQAFALVNQLKISLPLKIRLLARSRSPKLISGLLKGLNHADERVNAWSAWGLVQIGTVVEPTLINALSSPSSKLRLWAIWVLGQMGSERGISGLLQGLNHEDPQVRWRAATALGNLKNLKAIPKLRQLLTSDPDHYVRGRAATALGHLGSDSAIVGLKMALDDPEFYVYTNAVYGLETIGNSGAIHVLYSALHHKNSDVRTRGVEVLGKIGGEAAISKIVSKLNDPDAFVRAKVVETIKSISHPTVIKFLKYAQKDADAYVRSLATVALEKLKSPDPVSKGNRVSSQLNPLENPLLPKLWITSHSEAGEYILEKNQGANIQYLISIGSPGVSLPDGFNQVPYRLRLEFDDIDIPYNDPEYVLPNEQHILQAIRFMKSVNPKTGDLLVHCHGGMSRSTAIALTVCAYRLGRGKEEQALNYVLATRPQAIPNQWIVELADIVMKRSGKLMQLVRKHRQTTILF